MRRREEKIFQSAGGEIKIFSFIVIIMYSENSSKKRIIISLILLVILILVIIISTTTRKKSNGDLSTTQSYSQTSSPPLQPTPQYLLHKIINFQPETITRTDSTTTTTSRTNSTFGTILNASQASNTQLETTTTTPSPSPNYNYENENISSSKLLRKNFTDCDNSSSCIIMSETPISGRGNGNVINIKITSIDKNLSINFDINSSPSHLTKIGGKIEIEDNFRRHEKEKQYDDDEGKEKKEETCKARNVFISWERVRDYLVRQKSISIPGTWIGQPLMVKRCRNFLSPCSYKYYCSVSQEENVERYMKIVNDNQEHVANITLYFNQDKICTCNVDMSVVDNIDSVPYIYNVIESWMK